MAGIGVDRVYERRLAALVNSREQRLIARGPRGLERESLRVTPRGSIARTPHPRSLGAALTHPHITTDYSEALIELVTPTFTDNEELLTYLGELHQFVYTHLDDELLWATSMPCILGGDAAVPIARFGDSYQGRIKYIYRHGLLVRYGGMMQAISGVHFNYSAPQQFWPLYAQICEQHDSGQEFVSARYFDLLRNYRRYGWIVSYLFGASPALCRSFLQGREDRELDAAGAGHPARSGCDVAAHERHRLSQSQPGGRGGVVQHAAAIPVRPAARDQPAVSAVRGAGREGRRRIPQLSGNLLQIENEYYSYVRPKRALRAGERTTHALARAGVEYVEVRTLDNSAFDPVGVNLRKLYFLEAFCLLLLFKDSPPIDANEEEAIDRNHLRVARRGREPRPDARARPARRCRCAAGPPNCSNRCRDLRAARRLAPRQALQRHAARAAALKLEDVEQTPSARLLRELRESRRELHRAGAAPVAGTPAAAAGYAAAQPLALAAVRVRSRGVAAGAARARARAERQLRAVPGRLPGD
jgi:glutamate--cysteine ligase